MICTIATAGARGGPNAGGRCQESAVVVRSRHRSGGADRIELFHPAHFTSPPGPGMYQYLSKPEPYNPGFVALSYPGPDWWFLLHMIQTPLVGLVAVGLWLLVGQIGRADGHFAVALAWLSRAATLVFLIYYTALDLIGGTGLGRLLLNTQCLASQYSKQCSANNRSGAASDAGADRGNCAASQHQLGRPLGWRGRLVHQPDRLLRRVGRFRVRRIGPGAGTKGRMARPCPAPGVRLATASEPRQPARPDRLRSPDPLGAVDLVVRALRLCCGRSAAVASAVSSGTVNAFAGTAARRMIRRSRITGRIAFRRCRSISPPTPPATAIGGSISTGRSRA